MDRQFVQCAFATGGRAYTYHHDGDPLAVGDKVEVESRGGKATVEVVALVDEAPEFATKPVLAVVPPAPSEPADPDTLTGCADDQAWEGVNL